MHRDHVLITVRRIIDKTPLIYSLKLRVDYTSIDIDIYIYIDMYICDTCTIKAPLLIYTSPSKYLSFIDYR